MPSGATRIASCVCKKYGNQYDSLKVPKPRNVLKVHLKIQATFVKRVTKPYKVDAYKIQQLTSKIKELYLYQNEDFDNTCGYLSA